MRFSIDGISAGSITANLPRADVAATYPKYGAAHGFDLVLPASDAPHNICVTAVSVGGGANKTSCRQMDDIVGFEANAINYDTARAVLTGASLEQLDDLSHTNETTVQQSTEISGSRTTTDNVGWSSTFGLTVSASTSLKVGIPLFADGKITVTAAGSYSYTHNGSQVRSQTFSWRQPILVPAKSRVVATVAITRSTISVPYTLTGDFIYRSGARAVGSLSGIYAGGNSENLAITLKQYNLDGTPAAAPVMQPQAAVLKVTRE